MKRERVIDALPLKWWWAVLDLPEIGRIAVERFTVYGAVVEGLEQAILPLLGLGLSFGLTLLGLDLSGGGRGRQGLRLAWGAHTV